MILHTFGWAITVEIEDDGTISDAYPARVRFRGFRRRIIQKDIKRLVSI